MDWETPCTFTLLDVERGTPCTSKLLAAAMYSPCTSILLVGGKGYSLHVHTAGGCGKENTLCTSILLVVEWDTWIIVRK
jgi:hypothetical protein